MIPSRNDASRFLLGILLFLHGLACFIALVGIIIMTHEVGHFVAAKSLNVGVTKFSIGFGPDLIVFHRGETDYAISCVPIGGFVELVGMHRKKPVPAGIASVAFHKKSLPVRLAVIAAGPAANIFFAFLTFWIVAWRGWPAVSPVVGTVEPGGPAAAAGLLPNDRIRSVDGRTVRTWREVKIALTRFELTPVVVSIERQGESADLRLVQRLRDGVDLYGNPVRESHIGAEPQDRPIKITDDVLTSLRTSAFYTIQIAAATAVVAWKLISRRVRPEVIGGPFAIARLARRQAGIGFISFAILTAAVGVITAVINIMPIPVLDGGYICLYLGECIARTEIGPIGYGLSHAIGLCLLAIVAFLALRTDLRSLSFNKRDSHIRFRSEN